MEGDKEMSRQREIPKINSVIVTYNGNKKLFDKFVEGLIKNYLSFIGKVEFKLILSIILDTFFSNDFKQQCLHIHSIVFS